MGILVKDIMTKEVISVRRFTTLREILRTFGRFHIFPLVPVVNDDGVLIGIISFNDIVNIMLPHRPAILKTIPFLDDEEDDIFQTDITGDLGDLIIADDIMERHFISLPKALSIKDAYPLMKLHQKDELPVLDSAGKLAGMIGVFDIIRAIFRQKGVG